MKTVGEALRDSRIRFVCRRHTSPDPVGPTVTLVEHSWAVCFGRGEAGHQWHPIESTRFAHLGDPASIQDRTASY
jgi:hypothetical protein